MATAACFTANALDGEQRECKARMSSQNPEIYSQVLYINITQIFSCTAVGQVEAGMRFVTLVREEGQIRAILRENRTCSTGLEKSYMSPIKGFFIMFLLRTMIL